MRLNNSTLTKDWMQLHSTSKSRKKMYKAKKQWVVAGATLIALAGAGIAVSNAHASVTPLTGSSVGRQDNTNSLKLNSNGTSKISDKLNSNDTDANNLNSNNSNNNNNSRASRSQDNSQSSNNSQLAKGLKTSRIKNLLNTLGANKANTTTNNTNNTDKANEVNQQTNNKPLANQQANVKSVIPFSQKNKVVTPKAGNATQTLGVHTNGLNVQHNNANNQVSNNLIRNNPFVRFNIGNNPGPDVGAGFIYYIAGKPSEIVNQSYTYGEFPKVSEPEEYTAGMLAGADTFKPRGYHIVKDGADNPNKDIGTITSSDNGGTVDAGTLRIPVLPDKGHTPGQFMTVTVNVKDYGTDQPLGDPSSFQLSFNTDQLANKDPHSGNYDINSLISHDPDPSKDMHGPDTEFFSNEIFKTIGGIIKSKNTKSVNDAIRGIGTYSNFDIYGAHGIKNTYDQQYSDYDPLKNGGTYNIWFKNSDVIHSVSYDYFNEANGSVLGEGKTVIQPNDVGKPLSAVVGSAITSNAPDKGQYTVDNEMLPKVNSEYSNYTIQANQNGPFLQIPMRSTAKSLQVPIILETEDKNKNKLQDYKFSPSYSIQGIVGNTGTLSTSNSSISKAISSMAKKGFQLDSSKPSSYTIKVTGKNSYTVNGQPGKSIVFYVYNPSLAPKPKVQSTTISVPVEVDVEDSNKNVTKKSPLGNATLSGTVGSTMTITQANLGSLPSELASVGYHFDPGKTSSYTINITGKNAYTANKVPNGKLIFYVYDPNKLSIPIDYVIENPKGNKNVSTSITVNVPTNGTAKVTPTSQDNLQNATSALLGDGYTLDTSKPGSYVVKATGKNPAYDLNGQPGGTISFYFKKSASPAPKKAGSYSVPVTYVIEEPKGNITQPLKSPISVNNQGSTTITPTSPEVTKATQALEANGYTVDSSKPESYTVASSSSDPSTYTLNGAKTNGGTITFYLKAVSNECTVPVKFVKENSSRQAIGSFPSTSISVSGKFGTSSSVNAETPGIKEALSNIESQGYQIDPKTPSTFIIRLLDKNSYSVNKAPNGSVTFYLYTPTATVKNSTDVYYQLEDSNGNPTGSKVKASTVQNYGKVGNKASINPPNPASIAALNNCMLDSSKMPAMPTLTKGTTTSPGSVTFYYRRNSIKNTVQVYYQRDGQDGSPVPAGNSYPISVTPGANGQATIQITAPNLADNAGLAAQMNGWQLVSPSVVNKTITANTPGPIKAVFHYTQALVDNTLNIQTLEKFADGQVKNGPKYTVSFNKISPDSPKQAVEGSNYVPKTENGISWHLDTSNLKYPKSEYVHITKGTNTNPRTVYFLYDENDVQPNIRIERIEESSPGQTVEGKGFAPYTDSGQYNDGQEIEYSGTKLNPDPNDYELDTKTGPANVWAKVSEDSYTPDSAKGTAVLKFYYTPIPHPKPVQPVKAVVQVTLYGVPNPANGNPPTPVDSVPVKVSLMPGQTVTLNASQTKFANDPELQPGSTPESNNQPVTISRQGNGLNKYAVNFYYQDPYKATPKEPVAKKLQPIQFVYTDGTNTWKSPLIKPINPYKDDRQIDADSTFPTQLVGYYRIKGEHSTRFSDTPQEVEVPITKTLFNEDVKVSLVEEDVNGNPVQTVQAPDFTTEEHQNDAHDFSASDYNNLVPGYVPDTNHESPVHVTFGPNDDNASTDTVNLYYDPATEDIPVNFQDITNGDNSVGTGTAKFRYGTSYTPADAGNYVGIPLNYVLVPKQNKELIAGDPNSKDIPGNSTVNVEVAPQKCPPIHLIYVDQTGKQLGSTNVNNIRYTWRTVTQLGNDGWDQTSIPDTYYVAPNQDKEYQFGPDSGKTVTVEAIGRTKYVNYHIKRYLEAPDGEIQSEDSPIEIPAKMKYGDTLTFNIAKYPVPGYSPDPYRNGTSKITLHKNGTTTISNDAFYYRANSSNQTPQGNNQVASAVQPLLVSYLTNDGRVLSTRVLSGSMGQRINVTDKDTVPVGYYLDGGQKTEHTFSTAPAKPMFLYVSAKPVHTHVANHQQYRKINRGKRIKPRKFVSHDTYINNHKRNIVRLGIKHHFKWFWVIKTLRIHTGLKFNNHNYFKVIHPRDHFTFKILRIYRYYGRIRYMIRFGHRIGYVTGDRHWTQNAYFSRRILRKYRGHRHYIKFYHSTDFIHRRTKFHHLRRSDRIRRGTVMRIYGIKHIGPKYGGMTRFILGDGRYVTSNKNYVRIIK